MKQIVFAHFLFFAWQVQGQVKYNIETVNERFINRDTWQSRDSFYTLFEKPRESKPNERKAILMLSHSNNIFVNTGLKKNEILKEVEAFNIPIEKRQAYQVYANSSLAQGAVPVFDSMGVIAHTDYVYEENISQYRYRVLLNRKQVIIPWRPINLMSTQLRWRYGDDMNRKRDMGYIGEFFAGIGNSITIELKNILHPEDSTSISAVWIKRSPQVIATFTNTTMKDFMEVFKYQWKYDFQSPEATYYGDIKSKTVDSLLKLKWQFGASENSILFYLHDKVKKKEFVEYNLVRNGDSSGWKPNDFDMNVIWLKNLPPAKYSLVMRYSLQRQNTSNYSFEIMPAWYQTRLFTIAALILILTLAGFVIALIKLQRQKTKARQQLLQKQQTEAELKSIRSQFNPHFVFNALNSIQGLITRNDAEGANKYLTEFSTLLRDSLKASSNETVNLATEIKMIDTYLKLEQLRFGFEYKIELDESLNKNEIEVPALLLQPLIENAVKHGVSQLYDAGKVYLAFIKDKNDIKVLVSDNGGRFNVNIVQSGFGLKITNERIAVLNKTHPTQPISLFFESNKNGTVATIKFTNWLL